MKKLLVSGYVSLDRIIKVNENLKINQTAIITNPKSNQIHYGGCSVNIACLLSKLQVTSTPLLRVGYDFSSSGLKDHLIKDGVDLSGITYNDEHQTSLAYLIENDKKEHYTLFYPGAMDEAHFVAYNEQTFSEASMLIMTINSYKDNFELLRLARKYNLELVLGMKLDLTGFRVELLFDLLNYSSIIFANEYEAKVICKLFHLKRITDLFTSNRLKAIVITKGKQGATLYKKDDEIKVKAVSNIKVVDTTGAGDAFIAGFIYGYKNDYPLDVCCRYGAVLSSFIIQKYGTTTNGPTKEELDQRFKKVGEML